MMKFIQKNIQYPTMERENDIQGRVIVGFVVNEDGSISDIAVRKGVSSGLDKETVRVIKLFPKFKPGTQQGKPVRVQFMLPVMFKLAGGYSGPPPPPPVVNNDPHPMPVTSMPVPSPPPGVSKSEDEKNYTLPEFPGGIEALVKFINANNKYLRNSFGIKRYVTVWATIDEKGKVISPHVTSLTPKKDDDEALRIMKKLPKFKPATYKGKPQKWLYVIPVMFMD